MGKSFFVRPCKHPALFFALAVVAVNIDAGPPYQTDDPEPPEPGQWELFFAAYASAEATGVVGGCPQLEVNYGALDNLQLSLSPQMSYSASPRGVQAYSANYGLGDIELGAKYRFLKESGSCPQAAFYPQAVLPVGDQKRGLGAGYVQAFLPLWLQKSWGPWCAFGGGGYWINRGPGNRDWVFAGGALQRDLGDAFSVGGELFFHSAAQTDDVNGLGANLAFLWHLTKNDGLVFSAGRDLGVGSTTFTGYLAYRKVL